MLNLPNFADVERNASDDPNWDGWLVWLPPTDADGFWHVPSTNIWEDESEREYASELAAENEAEIPVSRSAALLAEARATDAAYATKLAQRSERRLAKAHTLQVEGALPCVSGELPPLGTSAGRRNAETIATTLVEGTRGRTVDGAYSYLDNDLRRDRASVRVANDLLKREGFIEELSRQWAVYGILPKIAHAVARTTLEGFGITVDAAGLKTLMRLVNPCTSRSGGRPHKVRIYTLLGPLSLPLGHSHPYTSDALPAPHVPSQVPLTPKGQTHGRGFGRGTHPLWGPSA